MDTEIVKEDLRKWFKDGGWNRYNTKGEKVGKCARDDKDGDGKADGPKPKCLPASKAASLGKKKVAAAVKRKRSEDPNPNRTGAAKNVKTESTEMELQIGEFMEACWKGYEKKGMKTMFGKRYPNCVKKTRKEEVELDERSRLDGPEERKKDLDKRYDPKGGGTNPFQYRPGKEEKTVKKESFQSFNEKAMKCWDTHKKVGMKMKGGKLVNDCRPKNEEVEVEESHKNPESVKGIAKELDKAVEMHKSQAKRLRKAGVSEGAAWTKKSGKNSEGGLNEKGRKSYERENPGSDLKRPSKKVGNKRRASFCARMKGMRKRQKPSNNTGEDRLSKSLRAWNC